MSEILCIALVVGIILFALVVAVSNKLGSMPPGKSESIMGGNQSSTFGIRYKDDCNDDNTWN